MHGGLHLGPEWSTFNDVMCSSALKEKKVIMIPVGEIGPQSVFWPFYLEDKLDLRPVFFAARPILGEKVLY